VNVLTNSSSVPNVQCVCCNDLGNVDNISSEIDIPQRDIQMWLNDRNVCLEHVVDNWPVPYMPHCNVDIDIPMLDGVYDCAVCVFEVSFDWQLHNHNCHMRMAVIDCEYCNVHQRISSMTGTFHTDDTTIEI